MSTFPNLTGDHRADDVIRQELNFARVDVAVDKGLRTGRVPTSLYGKLWDRGVARFQFFRGADYWKARGPISLPIAVDIFTDPRGSVIRAGGSQRVPPAGLKTNLETINGFLYVMLHRIDSPDALLFFIETIKKYGLVDR